MAVKGGHGNGSRGRSYGLLLMLAFGAAIFGVMILHKLRERRIYNLLVQEKDHQLQSLQLLLQKEKDNAKDAKRQVEETKAKMQKLRTKKMDLETAILEMESTISSLREEQRTIAATLEEKQNEIKVLMDRNRGGENRERARFSALTEALRQKEAEIEELKQQRVESPVKVWSVSADDPSNLPINFTAKSAAGKSSDADAGSNENINSGGETGTQTEVSSKQYHKKEDSQEVSSNTSNGNTINRSEVRTIIGDQARSIVNSESNGVMKLGNAYSSEILGRRTRGKRRRISITNRGGSEISLMKSETEGVDSMRSRKSFTESMESERDKRAEDDKERRNEYTLEDPKAELPNRIDAETVKSNLDRNDLDAITVANEKSADRGDKRDRIDNGETERQVDEGQEIKVTSTEYEKSPRNLQNMPANSTVFEDSRLLNKTENQKSEENGQPEVTNTITDNKDTEDHEASRITERDLKEDDPEVEDDQETETETETEIETEAVTSRNPTSDAEEDDETEF
ncbi:PREDICTED: eukaryotic translation initiation factor 5B-like [Ipomoea nil]|uniref:eukaryotic translation initiation factor 5B-like n=1 Tax=Ipomoea nil TaxID=35883 RepID=UPI000900AC73|nr:PREDICTED: eukaryotic translation initiation factor 5B-like [Ipomoea nil]